MTEHEPVDERQPEAAPEHQPDPSAEPTFMLCALGASAGGLAPVEEFFDAIEPDTGMAFVVVQHLSPDHESMMAALLESHTSMPVLQAVDDAALLANHVYLIPPGAEISVSGGRMQVRERKLDRRELHRPVDTFFTSLASDFGPLGIAVVLSGTGSDGTAGIERVRRAGGLTLVQQAAAFEGMPDAALRSGFVDASLSPTDIAKACMVYQRTGRRPVSDDHDDAVLNPATSELVRLLESESGISFSEYKPGTLRRRIERRITITDTGDAAGYLDRFRGDSEELEELTRDLLIDVTSFFRDPEMYGLLEREVIPQLVVEAASSADPVRAWVAGCSTGEEAYSMAILLLEAIESLHGLRPSIQIFATDIHDGSLRYATEGRYSDAQMAGVSHARRHRFFDEMASGWRVKPELRSVVTFARHNLLADAPFTRVDLVTCRNVLIYFQPSAQDRALGAMNFALRPGGALVLGSSEALGAVEVDYEVVSSTWRLHRKKADAVTRSLRAGQLGTRLRVPARTPTFAADQRLLRTYDALLEAHFASGLLLNERRELVHTIGAASEWLRQPTGRPTLDALSMVADPNLRLALGSTLRELETGTEKAEPRLIVSPAGIDRSQAMLLGEVVRVGGTAHYLLYTREAEVPLELPASLRVQGAPASDSEYTLQLEAELLYARESLLAALEEQETSNEELNAANEELIASNEELQSTNEELSSVNEELRTLNDEHHIRLDQVLELTADLEQLMSSTDIGVVFLAEDRTIRRFNEPARDYFRVRESDLNRPFEDLVSRLAYPQLQEHLDDVFEARGPRIETVAHADERGRRLVVRVDRYELPRDRWGVFVAVVDVTEVVVAEEERALASLLLASPFVAAIWNDENQLVYRNRSVLAGEGPIPYDPHSHIPVPAELVAGEFGVAANRARSTGETVVGYHTVRLTEGSEPAPGFEEYVFLFYPFDVAGQSLVGAIAVPAGALAHTVEARAQRLVAAAVTSHQRVGIATFDRDGVPLASSLVPGSGQELLKNWQQRSPEAFEDFVAAHHAAAVERIPQDLRIRGRQPDGSELLADIHIEPIEDPIVGAIGTVVHVGDYEGRIRDLEDEVARLRSELADERRSGLARADDLAERNQDLDNFAHVAAHDLKAPIRSVRSFAELAMDEISEGSPARPHMQQVVDASVRMTSLLESLLDFASIDRQRPNKEVIDLTDVVEEVMADLDSVLSETGATISRPSAFEAVHGDREGVRQVLINLVENAIKYSDGEPVVELSTRVEDDGVVIVVADNGLGFEMSEAERLFEPFQRLHDTSVSGNGVGLAICKRIVERQAGRIWASSTPGQGSRFSVWLPGSSD